VDSESSGTSDGSAGAGAAQKVGRFLDERRFDLFALASIALLALGPLKKGHLVHDKVAWTPLLVVLGLAAAAVAAVFNNENKHTLDGLRTDLATSERSLVEAERSERLAERRLGDALTTYAVNLTRRLDLGATGRLSLYAFDEETGFLRVLRHSENHMFTVGGRGQYPEGEGFISTAWQDGEVYVRDCPDRDEDSTAYRDFHLEQGLSPEAVDDLTMPSRSYYGIALYGPGGAGRVGVAMFESTRPRGLTGVRRDLDDLDRVSLGLFTVLVRPRARATGEDGEPL
jgi:hypothetical protein